MPRLDGPAKATGAARYVADLQLGDARPTSVLTKPFSSLRSLLDAVSGAIDSARVEAGPLQQLKDRVAAVVSEIAPGLKKL